MLTIYKGIILKILIFFFFFHLVCASINCFQLRVDSESVLIIDITKQLSFSDKYQDIVDRQQFVIRLNRNKECPTVQFKNGVQTNIPIARMRMCRAT